MSFVLTNIPMVYPLFRDLFNRMRGKTGQTTTSSYSNQSGRAYPLGSYPRRLGDKSGSNSRSRDPHSLPTFDDSKEQIVTEATERPPSDRGGAPDDAASFELPKQSNRGPSPTTAPVIESNQAIADRRRATRDLEAGLGPPDPEPYQPRHQRGPSREAHRTHRSPSMRRDASRGTSQIVVTTEYTVSGTGPNQERGSGYVY